MTFAPYTTKTRVTSTPAVTLRAPSLAPIVDVLLALHEDPSDTRARIQAALLHKEGLDGCPSCQAQLDVAGYVETREVSRSRRAIRCLGCDTLFVVAERHVA